MSPAWLLMACGVVTVCFAATPLASPPLKVQALLMGKIATFDRTLEGRKPVFLVLHAEDETSGAEEMVRLCVGVGLRAQAVMAAELAGTPRDAMMMYVLPHVKPEQYRDFTVQRRILTFAAGAAGVRKGEVAVGFSVREDGRPEMMVNLPRMRAEGHALESSLLSISTVFY